MASKQQICMNLTDNDCLVLEKAKSDLKNGLLIAKMDILDIFLKFESIIDKITRNHLTIKSDITFLERLVMPSGTKDSFHVHFSDSLNLLQLQVIVNRMLRCFTD